MAIEIQGQKISLIAGEDMTTKQFHIVKMSGDFTVVTCSAVTDDMVGIVQNNPKIGQPAEIMINGVSKVRVDANIAAGDRITTSADGQATTEVAGSYTFGRALAAASTGSLGSILIDTSVPVKKA